MPYKVKSDAFIDYANGQYINKSFKKNETIVSTNVTS